MDALAQAEQALSRLVVLAESSQRCPYRTADDRCSAAFGCRNQRRAADVLVCGAGPGDLDWRDAWSEEDRLRRARS